MTDYSTNNQTPQQDRATESIPSVLRENWVQAGELAGTVCYLQEFHLAKDQQAGRDRKLRESAEVVPVTCLFLSHLHTFAAFLSLMPANGSTNGYFNVGLAVFGPDKAVCAFLPNPRAPLAARGRSHSHGAHDRGNRRQTPVPVPCRHPPRRDQRRASGAAGWPGM